MADHFFFSSKMTALPKFEKWNEEKKKTEKNQFMKKFIKKYLKFGK